MTLRHRLSIEWLLLIALAGSGQTAEEFFNSGAQSYISNNIPAALQTVETARKEYPDDVKLKKLEELLKQQQQQNQNQQQQNQNQQQNKQNSSKDQKGQSPSSPQSQNGQNPAQPDQQKPPSPSGAGSKNQPENAEKQAELNQAKSKEMSAEEARRLLDGQKGDEKILQYKPPTAPQNPSKPLKDW